MPRLLFVENPPSAPLVEWSVDAYIPILKGAAAAAFCFLILFGPIQFGSLIFYAICFVLGFIAMFGFVAWTLLARKMFSAIAQPRSGIAKALSHLASQVRTKLDRRITGQTAVDAKLREVIDLMIRDYVEYWYQWISNCSDFPNSIRETLQNILIALSARCKAYDWVKFITGTIIDAFIDHLQRFRAAQTHVETTVRMKHGRSRLTANEASSVEEKFFEDDPLMGICCSPEKEAGYLRDLSEALLYVLLPQDSFQCPTIRTLFREMLGLASVKPTIDMVADPDYINQCIAVWIDDSCVTYSAVIEVIKTSVSTRELQLVVANTETELQGKLHCDRGDVRENNIRYKAEIDNLLTALRECTLRKKELMGGVAEQQVPIKHLTLESILADNTAVACLQEYMRSVGKVHVVDFILMVDQYRAFGEALLADAGTSKAQLEKAYKSIKELALTIFYQYLADNIEPRVPIDFKDCSRVHDQILSARPSLDVFKHIQTLAIEHVRETDFPQFRGSALYYSYLHKSHKLTTTSESEAGAASGGAAATASAGSGASATAAAGSSLGEEESNDDNVSMSESLSSNWEQLSSHTTGLHDSTKMSAEIENFELANVSGKQVCYYRVRVSMLVTDTGHSQTWICLRRYSDFNEFSSFLKDRLPSVVSGLPSLPSKRAFGNMSNEFLEKRMAGLRTWLAAVTAIRHPQLKQLLYARFLRQGDKDSSNKEAVKLEDEENTSLPFRILLRLFDVIFELRTKGGLRRRLMGVLSTLVHTTFGDRINSTIIETIDKMTASEQLEAQVENFKQAWWPGGVMAPEASPRSEDCKLRTRVEAKAKLFGTLPDELKRVVGQATAKQGILSIFEMLQYPRLNKRLMYGILEALIINLFPEHRFTKIFETLHNAHRADKAVTQALKVVRASRTTSEVVA
eukprot:m.207214 g.207214  ORF g.207214 m.207214 type:complete len:915 (+) comp17786_c0_seq3:179-2923(+)